MAAGVQNGTTMLPSGIEQQLSKPGSRVVSSGSRSFSGMPASPCCRRMRKSCLVRARVRVRVRVSVRVRVGVRVRV